MTVTYTLSVAEARLNAFPKLLLKWRGSIYKLLYREIAIFLAVFYSIRVIHHFILNKSQQQVFNNFSQYCDAFTNFIPLSFVLGFYVSMVVGRWWQQFLAIPWPDNLSMLISGFVTGNDERSKSIRAALVRYMLTMKILTLQAISTSIRKRFPTEEDLVEAGIMTPQEFDIYTKIDGSHGKWWVPGQWFTALATQAHNEGRIKSEIFLSDILKEMHAFRASCGMLFAYDWISIPLVYTQTVTIAVYTYFGAKVVGRQFTETNLGEHRNFNSYVPFITLLEFFFFMGWLKVAEQLINPFGEDDDDYDCNWIIDRNLLVSYIIIDDMYAKSPPLGLDGIRKKSNTVRPDVIQFEPQRKNSVNPHIGSTADLNVKNRRPSRVNDSLAYEIGNEVNLLLKPDGPVPQNRTMSLCVPSEYSIKGHKGNRKLSLEERPELLTPRLMPKLQTHVEISEENSMDYDEETESVDNNNNDNDDGTSII